MATYTQPHLASSIIMVKPVDFGFNEQTGLDNEFQNRPQLNASDVTQAALKESMQMVENLQRHQIDVIVLDKSHTTKPLPDAVFPNNWFSTRSDGTLTIYPMKTANRQDEVQISQLKQKLTDAGYHLEQVQDLRSLYPPGKALEGTGSLIFHHPSGQIFAAVSERCDAELLQQYSQQFSYQLHPFESQSSQGAAIYHTNVLMSCGQDFAVIADSVLVDNPLAEQALAQLKQTVSDVISISEEQMSQHFCGNIIQLKNNQNTPCIVMSQSAFEGFSHPQKRILEKHGQLIPCQIPTIEHIGGGSARCMIAENFLPKA